VRFHYLDAALQGKHGHHAEYCRLITNELRQRGIDPNVLGYQQVAAELDQSLKVQPFFRWFTYSGIYRTQDPIAGWMRDFDVAGRITIEDLKRIVPVSADDIVYFSSVYPAQFMAVLLWLKGIPPDARPTTFVEFGTDPGVVLTTTTANTWQFEVMDPRRMPRGMLYRYTGSVMKADDFPRVCLFTFDRIVSSIYQALTCWPVATLPWPHQAILPLRSRLGRRPIRAAILGHQRTEKGFQFVPDVLRAFSNTPEIEFLVHNAMPEEMIESQKAVREIAQNNPRIIVDERSVFGPEWAQILDKTDLVICPYDPVRYSTSHSAIVAECVASGIPCVVPTKTVLAAMCQEFGGTAAEIPEWSARGIVAGIRAALADFESLATRAAAAAPLWQQRQGAPRLVDRLLAPVGHVQS
jgi:hypothetical protein